MKIRRKSCVIFGLICVLLFSTGAWAGIMLHPTRVIIDNRYKSGKVSVVNTANSKVKYRVRTIFYRETNEGRLEPASSLTDQERLIQKMLRFSPRQAVLNPKERQTIRLQFRKNGAVPDGEYRIHLNVFPVPDPQIKKSPLQTSQPHPQGESSIKINFLVGLSIPVVIRNGDLWVEAEPVACTNSISKDGQKKVLKVNVQRRGSRSAIIDIAAYHSLGHDLGNRVLIGELKGVVIYPEYTEKEFEIPIDDKTLPALNKGIIRIELKDSEIRMTRGKKAVQYDYKDFDISSITPMLQ